IFIRSGDASADTTYPIPVEVLPFEPFVLSTSISATASGSSWAGAQSHLSFSGLPSGYAVLSCQGFISNQAVPARLSRTRADADSRSVTLAWLTEGSNVLDGILERRHDSSGWIPIATLTSDGTGRLEYEDRDVHPGVRYGYRLSIRPPDSPPIVDEVWV